jgi:N-methylhydantoinase A
VAAFHARHVEADGYDIQGHPVEFVTLRLVVTRPRPAPPPEPGPGAGSGDPIVGRRPVWFAGNGFTSTPVYDRARLAAGARFEGPAVVEQMDTTTVIPPDATAAVDEAGNIVIALSGLGGDG